MNLYPGNLLKVTIESKYIEQLKMIKTFYLSKLILKVETNIIIFA